MFFVFFLQVGKIWWFLSFIMKLEKFDDWYLLTWQRDGMCHHRTVLMHLPVTFPPCLDMVLLLIMIIPSAHLYRDDLELLSFNLKFPEKEWYVEEKKRRVRILGGHTVFIAPHYLWGSTSYKSYGSLLRRLHPRTGLLFVVRLVRSIPSVVNFSVFTLI